jgi:transposase
MSNYSSREAAQLLGISPSALAHFVKAGRVTGPKFVIPGKRNTHLWTEEQIARLRKRLPRLVKGTRIGQKYKLAAKAKKAAAARGRKRVAKKK